MKQRLSENMSSIRRVPAHLLRLSITVLAFWFLMSASSTTLNAQSHAQEKAVDTSPIELYLQNTDFIRKNGRPDVNLLRGYFSNATIKVFMQRPGFDSLKFVNSLISVYSNKPITDAEKDDEYNLMVKYKENESVIRTSIDRVKKTDIDKLVKKRLKTFYPKSFNLDSIRLRHVYLFLEEGNSGMQGYVFNSALQTAYLDKKDLDLISSHEAYHSITSSIFFKKFKGLFNSKADETVTSRQNLVSFLEFVSEEGIADLIDKKIISSGTSPLVEEIRKLRVNEVYRSEQKIRQLDSLLANNAVGSNFSNLNGFSENGGHIPGRYMGEKIQAAKLLDDFVEHTGNPFRFFYLYNEAVKDLASAPKFSDKSISNLKALEALVKGL
jgi:hypothetical protein